MKMNWRKLTAGLCALVLAGGICGGCRTADVAATQETKTMTAVEARFELDGIFQSHMVLPIGRPVPVSGYASPLGRVEFAIDGAACAYARAGLDGRFTAWLPAMAGGGTVTLAVLPPASSAVTLIVALPAETAST